MPIISQSSLDDEIAGWFHPRMRSALTSFITPEIVREHGLKPFGQHSDQLQRLQNYLGQFPINGKLVVEYGGREGDWWVSRMSTQDGLVSVERGSGPFISEAAAVHAVFTQRLTEIFGIDIDTMMGESE